MLKMGSIIATFFNCNIIIIIYNNFIKLATEIMSSEYK